MVGGHGGYMAEGFRDGLPAKPKDPRMDLRKGVGASAPITKNQPLHVDGVAERKRRELEYYRDINVDINGQGEGCSGVTWMRGRGQAKQPIMSAGANYPPRTAKGQVQQFRPGQTRPASAGANGPSRDNLYTGQGTDRKGVIQELMAAKHGPGFEAKVLLDEEAWPPEWPAHHNTDRPVIQRRVPHRKVDAAGQQLNAGQGLEAMFGVSHRRGNREAARMLGQHGIFQGDDGAWLKRMWKANAWAEKGGVRGVLSSAQGDERHQAVGDGFAPPRQATDGWGAKKWPLHAGHWVAGKPNQTKRGHNHGRMTVRL
ncbi:hypothetical protein T484DRAFT_1796669 [Baffinella frigidus]|nr:hypothetical protein T484DRAFT_1796669 [Cryptophyta sp. CCMP2293]